MTLSEWLIKNKDSNLATCILNIRNLKELNEREVQELHEFLWLKQKIVAKQFEL